MKDLLINSMMNKISRYGNYDEIKLKEIKYGLSSLYLNVTKIIVIFTLSYLLGNLKTLLILMGSYGILRLSAFGVHAKKSIHCWIASLLIFILIPILCEIIIFNMYIKILICLTSIILLFIYAPADTEKRPLIHKKRRIIYKYATLITSIIYTALIFVIKNNIITNCLLFSLIISSTVVLPITYKLFGVKYNNYKNYKKGGYNK